LTDWFYYAYIAIASLVSYFLGYLLAKREMRGTLQQNSYGTHVASGKGEKI